jgi:subtilase family serine protease
MDLQLFHNGSAYYLCFPALTTNAATANPLNTGYFVWSQGSSTTSGIHGEVYADGTGGSGSGTYHDYLSFLTEITNRWTLLVTNAVATNTYTFYVSSFSSNALPETRVTFPVDGATDVTNRPTFTWWGPTNYDQLYVQVNNADYSFARGDHPPLDQTRWPLPENLSYSTSYSFIAVYNNFNSGVLATTPVDSSAQPFPGWISTTLLQSYNGSTFTVGNPFPTAKSGGHTNLAHYAFDDSGNLGRDSSGNGNDLTGASWWGPVHEPATDTAAGGGAVRFFGTSTLTPNGTVLANWLTTLAGSFSVSAWVKTTDSRGDDSDNADSGATIFWAFNDQYGTNDTIPLAITGSKAAFTTRDHLGNLDTLHSGASVTDGNYHLLTVTRDHATGLKTIYVDGNLQASAIGTTDPLNGNDYYLSIGGSTASSYTGLLDDLQFYSGVLSPAEVTALYNNPGSSAPDIAGSGPVARYDFDEGVVLAADVSGNGNNIIYAGNFGGSGPTMSSDTIAGSGSVSFDGSSYLTASSNLLATLARDFSVSLWVKTSQSVGAPGDMAYSGAVIVSADLPTGGAGDAIPIALTAGQVAFNTGDGNSDDTLNSIALVNNNDWHHLVVTRNQATGEKQIYIDGTLDRSAIGTTALLDGPQLLTIGAKSDASDPNPASPESNGSQGYEGLLDEIQIYGTVLSAAEILYLYQHPGATGTNQPNPLGEAVNAPNLVWTTDYDVPWFVQSTNTHDGISAAQSGPLFDNHESRIQTQVNGPVTVNFWWNIVGGDGNNFLAFIVDGSYYWDEISGDQGDWTEDSFIIGPGSHTLTWRYYRDGSTSTGDAGLLDEVSISSQVAPQITWNPSNISVQAGSNAVLTVELYANPPATIVWLKNGSVISGATSSTLVITNAQLSDSGDYQLIASNSVETAYSSVARINVYVPTDLRPLSLTAPLVVGSQTKVPVSWLATNTGPGTVNQWYDYLSFATNETVLYFMGSGSLQPAQMPLAAATTYSISNLFRIPAVPAGNYSVLVKVDASESIIETNETNNTLAIPITVINPDLQPTELRVAGGIGGQPLQVVWTVVNHGPGLVQNDYAYYYDRLQWYDRFYLSTNSVWDANAVLIGSTLEAAHLAAGDHLTQTNVFTLPPVTTGNYYVHLRVDPEGYVRESTKTNNNFGMPLQVTVPDLVSTHLTAPAVVSSGQSVSMRWMAENQGDAVATNAFGVYSGYQWADQLLLSRNQQPSGQAALLGYYTPWHSALAPGQSMSNSASVTIPGVPQGDYYVVLAVDYGNNVLEVNETNNYFSQPIQVLNPDLAPVSLTAPVAAEARSIVQVVWKVANQGAGDALLPAWPWRWEDVIYISTNSVWDSHATALGSAEQFQSIPSGTNYIQSIAVTLPGFAAGNYYLILSVDRWNYLYEFDETNNYRSIPISIGSPDLAAGSLTAPTNASSQQPITALYSAANVGGVTAPAGWADRLYLSPDGLPGTNNIAMIDVTRDAPLPVGNSYTQLMNTAIPAVPAGDYYLLLEADGNHFFAEPNLANNFLGEPIHIVNPDLLPTNFIAPVSVVVTQSQQRFEADWTAVNQGVGGAYHPWWDYVYLSPTNVLDTNAVYVGAAYQSTVLGPGETYVGFDKVTLPDGIEGSYYLILQLNTGGNLFETSLANNTLIRPLQVVVPPVPVLSVVSVQSPPDAWSGTEIQVSWVLTNAGNAPVEGTFYDQVSLASDAAGHSPQAFGTFPFTGRIEPGQSVLRQQRISLPLNFSGLFWVEVQTDLSHSIFQHLSRTNDSLVASQPMLIHLTPTPNLAITSVAGPSNCFSSDQVLISWIETNLGIGPTRSPYWYDAVYLSSSTNLTGAIYSAYLGVAPNASFLNSGDSYANSLNVGIPRGIDGTYYFIVVADGYNYVFEGTNKNDNQLVSGPVTVHLTPTPDLQITSVSPPHNAFSGQSYPMQWSGTNYGLGQTTPRETEWWDRVYLSTNNFLDTSATSLGLFRHSGGLAPGSGYTASNSVVLPVGISGDYYFLVQGDSYNQVYEGAFEDNNTVIATFPTVIALTPPPDLEMTILQSPSHALAQHLLSVTYAVANHGSTVTPNSWWGDAVYLSTNTQFDATAVRLAYTWHYAPLSPGGAYTNTVNAMLSDAHTGTNYIFVVSDPENSIFELNKSNNLAGAVGPVVIESRYADLAAVALRGPAQANIGDGILVSWAVTNTGAGDTAVARWSDRILLSQNPLLGAPSDVSLLDLAHDGLLNPLAGYGEDNHVVQVPAGLVTGDYYLFLIADLAKSAYETNRNNNVFGPVPIHITANSADLAIISFVAPTNAFSGSNVVIQWNVKNIGNQPPNAGFWYDFVYLSPNGILGPDAVFLGWQVNPTNLPPGECYTNTLATTLPLNVQSNYYFVVVCDPYRYVAEPGLKANNTLVLTPPVFINFSAVPDLAITSVLTPADAYSGQSFTLSWVVKNVGTAPASGGWYDVAYLSLDQFLDRSADTYLGYRLRLSDLAPEESYTNTTSFDIPQGFSGPFYVFISADPSQVIFERGLLDNNVARASGVMQGHLTPPVDLVAGAITIPANAVPGRNATITYTVFNQGANTALGSWDDSLYLSIDTNWNVSDELFTRVHHQGDLPPNHGYTNTVVAPMPGVLPGTYYLIVRSDILNHLLEADKSNNIAASLTSARLDVEQLTLGTPSSGTISSGQSAFFKFDASAGQTIHLQFTTAQALANNELFVRYGEMPDSGQFDIAANDPFVADPDLYLPAALSGTYYVLVHSDYTLLDTPYSILAEVLPFTIKEVSPLLAGNAGQTTFKVRGALFSGSTGFQLQTSTNSVTASEVLLEDSSTAYVTFDLAGVTPGVWNLQAAMGPTNSVTTTLSNAVSVVPGTGPIIDVSISGALAVNPLSLQQVLVFYGNSGDSDTMAPLILVNGRENTPIGTSPSTLGSRTIQFLGRSLEGPPSVLRPQISGSQGVFYKGGGLHLEARGIPATSKDPITDADWLDIESAVRPRGISDAAWLDFWSNVRPRVGTTWGDYVRFLNRVAVGFPSEQCEVQALVGTLFTTQPGFRASSSLSGTILGSADGMPQAGVEVGFFLVKSTGAAVLGGRGTTDTNGQFNIPYITPGRYVCVVDNGSTAQFDMDHNDLADPQAPTVTVLEGADVSGQTIYLHQPSPVPSAPGVSEATLLLDAQNILHVFWYYNEKLWHAWNNHGEWVRAQPISTNWVSGFAVASGANLVDRHSPGLLVVWCEGGTNSANLLYAVGQASSGGYRWSQPAPLTRDPVENSCPAVIVRNDGLALISYLKRGIAIHDDSDVYYSAVDIASGTLVWTKPASLVTPRETGWQSAETKINGAFQKGWVVPAFGYDLKLQLKGAIEGTVQGCSASAAIGGSGQLFVENDNWKYFAEASGDGQLSWDVNPDNCAWEYNGDASAANFHFKMGVEAKNALFRALSLWPATATVAGKIERGVQWLEREAGIAVENSVEVNGHVDLKGCSWRGDAPLQNFGLPDIASSEGGVGCVLKFGLKYAGKQDIRLDDGTYKLVPDTTGEMINRLGFEGNLGFDYTFQLYPTIKSLTVTAGSGSIKVTFPSGLEFTYQLSPFQYRFNESGAGIVQPRGDDPEFLPEGWTFSYNPSSVVGTGKTYGTNSILGNVATDLYDDGAPALANDPSGSSYQIWYKSGNPYLPQIGSQLYMADYDGTNWAAASVIPGTFGFNTQVSAATDRLGHRVAVWVHGDTSGINTDCSPEQFFGARSLVDLCYAVFDGSAWSTPQRVAVTRGPDSGLQVSTLPNGELLAVWTYTGTNSVVHLLSSRWDGTTWAAADEITSGAISAPTAQQIGLSTYLLWTQVVGTNQGQILKGLLQSVNTAGSWSKPIAFDPALFSSSAPPTVPVLASHGVQPRILAGWLLDPKCCRCKDKTTTKTNSNPEICGISSVTYNYTNCTRTYTYKACGRASFDPNEITGPTGYGPERWVPALLPLNYTIFFENDPKLANAPAKQVTISLPLDPNLDPRTFRLGTFGFGGLTFNVPANSAFYQTRLDFTADRGFYLDVFAGVDVANRRGYWILTTIDPETGDIPRNPLLGFLPPNVTSSEGEGFVSCTALPLSSVTTGSRVTAKATIVFDNQPPLDTPSIFNTIQTGTPVSSVLPLPAVAPDPVFNVAWQGASAPGGSSLASFDIYVSQDGGPYLPWLQQSTLNQAPYVGQPGGLYAFYSIARDNVGAIQPIPPVADAYTLVSTNSPPVVQLLTNALAAPDVLLSLRVKASDPNQDPLTFSLAPGAPAGATIGVTNGAFRWRPTRAFAETTNLITVQIADDGLPPLSTNTSFWVAVSDYLDLTLGATNVEGGQSSSIPIFLASNAGVTNLVFTVQIPEHVLNDLSVAAIAPHVAGATLVDQVTNVVITLTTAPGQSLLGTQLVSRLSFRAAAIGKSGFVPLPVINSTALKPSGMSYVNYVLTPGAVAVVQDAPLLEALESEDQSRSLMLYGKLGTNYQVQFSTSLLPVGWQPLLYYTQTNGVMNLGVAATNPVIFYRLKQE